MGSRSPQPGPSLSTVFTRATLFVSIFFFAPTLDCHAAAQDSSSLRLLAEIEGRTYDRFGVDHDRIVMRDGGKNQPVPANAVWKLEGDLGRDDSLPAFSPWFRIWQQPSVAADDPLRYSAVVRIERGWPWSIGELDQGILVLAWLVDGKPLLVTPIVPNLELNSAKREAAIHAFDLRSDNVRGVPIALLLGPHGFVRSTPRFLNKAAQKILADLNLRSPEVSLISAQRLSSLKPEAPKALTILHSAAAAGRVELVNYLLSRGGDPDLDSKQSTPLRLAAANGRNDVIKAILAAKSSAAPGAAIQPVAAALDLGHLDTAMLLFNASVADQAMAGRIAALAIQQDRSDVLAELLAKYRDLDLASVSSFVIGQALLRRDHEILDLILASGMKPDRKVEGIPWLVLSTYAGDVTNVGTLLHAGAAVDAPDPQGITALMIAAQGGRRDVLQVLLTAGADPNHQDGHGITSLHLATAAGQLEIVAELLAHGARVDLRDETGRSALDLALIMQSRPAISMLVAAGAKLSSRNPSFGAMVIQAIILDQADLLRGDSASGWNPELPVFESLTASEVAEASGAKATADWLKSLSLPTRAGTAWTIERQPDSPAKPTHGGRPADPRPRDQDEPAVTVTVTGVVDVGGRFLFPRIESCPDARLAEAVLIAAPTWQFAPASRHGIPVNSLLTLSIPFSANQARVYDLADIDVFPTVARTASLRSKESVDVGYASVNGVINGGTRAGLAVPRNFAIAKVPPAFGFGSMVYTVQTEYGNWTVLAFVVEPDGKPSNIAVVSSKNRDFAQSAVKALENYRFFPGLRAGLPVRSHMTMTLQPDN